MYVYVGLVLIDYPVGWEAWKWEDLELLLVKADLIGSHVIDSSEGYNETALR